MIDWPFLLVQSLWIFGLSIVLAAFSYHNWLRQTGLRGQLADPASRLMLNAGVSLVALGFMLLRSAATWERVVWGLIALACAWHGWMAWRKAGDKQ